jgi:DNA-3-methyladenine glycosylase I
MTIKRCEWCLGDDAYIRYHDEEWGVPVHDDRKWFEFIVLESAQAGLSWLTILRRRENYRHAFAGFDPVKVAEFNDQDIERLMNDAGIIRNRQKISAAVNNARAFLKIQEEFGSFDNYMWRFVDGKPIINHWRVLEELPAKTELSEKIAKDMKKRGFGFFGPVICYAHMQAAGMVNDHLVSCFRHDECGS